MTVSTAESLRLVNRTLAAVLDGWQSKPGEPGAFTLTVFTDLLAALKQAAELLRGISPSPATGPQLAEPQLEKEIADYYRNVQQLEEVLPAIQGRLLSEKARLESARAHLAAAAAWADGRKKTL